MPRIAGFLPQQTTRQQAFDRGMERSGQGAVDFVSAMLTQRQKAFDDAMRMRAAGYDVTPEQLRSANNMFAKPESFNELFSKRTPEFEQARSGRQKEAQERELERQKKQQREDEMYNLRKQKLEQEINSKMNKAQQDDKLAPQGQQPQASRIDPEMEIPGHGVARSRKEAIDIRQSMADANDAVKMIDQLKELGTDVAIWDRGRINKINSLKKILAGKLRLPLTGPGAMTEDEFKRLIDTMGDPSDIMSTEAIEMGKLDQLKDILNQSVQSKIASSVISPVQGGQPSMLTGSQMNVPYAPMNAPDMMPEAMAGQEVPVEAIVSPERTQLRRSRIQELRMKAQGGM